jgi:hypothetical protein
MAFATNTNVEKMRLDASGNLGIGTTSPGAKLDVVGKIKGVANGTVADTNAYGFRFSTSTNTDRVLWGGYDNALNVGFIQATELNIAHTNLLLNPNGGNVGIGTTAPGSALTVARGASSGAEIAIQANGNSAAAQVVLSQDSGSAAYLFNRANQFMSFGTNNTERMRIDSSGNVGIGTTAPTAGFRLHAVNSGGSNVIASTSSDVGGVTTYMQANTSTSGIFGTLSNHPQVFVTNNTERMRIDSAGQLGVSATPSAWGAGFKAIQMQNGTVLASHPTVAVTYLISNSYYDGTNDRYIVNGFASTLVVDGYQGGFNFRTAVTGTAGNVISYNDRMRITEAGDVGIGTSAPGAALVVARDSSTASVAASASIVLRNRNTSINGTIMGGIFSDTFRDVADPHYSGGIWFARIQQVGNASSSSDIVFGGENTVGAGVLPAERMRIVGSSGSVGIGTSAPGTTLEVTIPVTANPVAPNGLRVNIAGLSADGFSARLYTATTSVGVPYAQLMGPKDGNGYLAFNTGGSDAERMRIDSTGRVGIGTSAPNAQLVVAGTGFIGDIAGARNTLYLKHTASTSNQSNAIIFGSNGSGGCAIYNDINADGTTVNQLNVYAGSTGGVYLGNGATAWASASDERVKDIIEPILNAVQKVGTLRAVIGKYKTDAEGTRRSFLIAQDVQAVLPEAVNVGTDEQQTLGVAYTDTIPLLVAAIKELTARVAQLEGNQP